VGDRKIRKMLATVTIGEGYDGTVNDAWTAPPEVDDIIDHLLERPVDALDVMRALSTAKIAGPWEGPDFFGRHHRACAEGIAAWVYDGGGDSQHISGCVTAATKHAADRALKAAGWVLADEVPE